MPIIRTTLRVENITANSQGAAGVPNLTNSVNTDSSLISQSVQLVGTSHVAAQGGAVGDGAYVVVQNESTTATLTVGGDAAGVFVPWFTIPPGAPPAIIPRINMSALFLRSSAANTQVLISSYKIFINPPPTP
jgi:hypothetical protein